MDVLVIDERRVLTADELRILRRAPDRSVDLATVPATALAMCASSSYHVVVIIHDAGSPSPWTHVYTEVRRWLPGCRVLVVGADDHGGQEFDAAVHLPAPVDIDQLVGSLRDLAGRSE